jgi:Tol biopolymer transport system component
VLKFWFLSDENGLNYVKIEREYSDKFSVVNFRKKVSMRSAQFKNHFFSLVTLLSFLLLLFLPLGAGCGGSNGSISTPTPTSTSIPVSTPTPTPISTPTPNPVRKIIFTGNRNGHNNIYSISPDGTEEIKLTNGFTDNDASWSPDGSKITFTNNDGNFKQIYVIDSNGANQKRLTNTDATEENPIWSPDGKKILFASDRDGTIEIYIMYSNGTNQKRLTHNWLKSFIPSSLFSWSPDSKKIAFFSDRDTPSNSNYEIYTIDVDGHNEKRLTSNNFSDYDAHWSPDGSKIAFLSNRDNNTDYQISLYGRFFETHHLCWGEIGHFMVF